MNRIQLLWMNHPASNWIATMWCFAPAYEGGFRTQHPIRSSHSTILIQSSHWSKLFLWLHGHKFSWTPTDPWVQRSPKRCNFSPLQLIWCHTSQAWLGRGLQKCGRENAFKGNDSLWRGLMLNVECGMKSNIIFLYDLHPSASHLEER